MKKLAQVAAQTSSFPQAFEQASGSKGSSPGAADQLGQSTAFKKDQVDAGRGYNPTKYGNEVALNGKSAPGQGALCILWVARNFRTSQSRQLSTSPRHPQ